MRNARASAFLLVHRTRWERERPFWFDEAWRRRIPLRFLQDLDVTTATTPIISQREAAFRKATHGTAPWDLADPALSEWLEENWVKSESQDAEEKITQLETEVLFIFVFVHTGLNT